jgi:hypothetical protein
MREKNPRPLTMTMKITKKKDEEPGPNIGDLDASAELTQWVI